MALADILQKIHVDAEERAEQTLAKARARASEIKEVELAKAKAEAQHILEEAHKRAVANAEAIRINGRLDVNKIKLSAQRELLNKSYEDLKTYLISLPEDEYISFLARLIIANARGGETLVFGLKESERVGRVVARVDMNSEQPLSLKTDPSEFVSERTFDHGVLIKGERVDVDLSIDAVIENAKRDLEPVLVHALFGEDEV